MVLGYSGLISSSLVKGVATASTIDGVGLALNRHGPLNGERLGQVLELRQDHPRTDLLKDVHGAAVRLGHASVAHVLLPHADRVTLPTALKEGDPGEAVLIPGVLVDNVMVVLHALTTAEGLGPGQDRKGRRHATCGLAIKPDTPLRFPLELLLQVAGKGAASVGGKGDTVAGKLKLGCGEQALAWARDISELVVVVVTTEAAELVLQQVGALKLDPLAIKEHSNLGGLENHNIVLGLDDLGNNVALPGHDGVPLTHGYLNGAAVDLNDDMLTLGLHGDIGATDEDLDLLLGLRGVAARGLKGANKNTIGHGLGAVTREKMEAVIHIGPGCAVVKGGDVLAFQGAHREDGLASSSLDASGDRVNDIRDRIEVGEGVGQGHIPVLVLLLRVGDIGDLNIVGAMGRVDSSPHLHLIVVIARAIAGANSLNGALNGEPGDS